MKRSRHARRGPSKKPKRPWKTKLVTKPLRRRRSRKPTPEPRNSRPSSRRRSLGRQKPRTRPRSSIRETVISAEKSPFFRRIDLGITDNAGNSLQGFSQDLLGFAQGRTGGTPTRGSTPDPSPALA